MQIPFESQPTTTAEATTAPLPAQTEDNAATRWMFGTNTDTRQPVAEPATPPDWCFGAKIIERANAFQGRATSAPADEHGHLTAPGPPRHRSSRPADHGYQVEMVRVGATTIFAARFKGSVLSLERWVVRSLDSGFVEHFALSGVEQPYSAADMERARAAHDLVFIDQQPAPRRGGRPRRQVAGLTDQARNDPGGWCRSVPRACRGLRSVLGTA